jgi:DNA-binding NarL/FixJ family response regulator
VVVDDHAPLRAAVRRALEAGGCMVVAEGGTVAEAEALALAHRPDILLVDVHMPDGRGVRAVETVTRQAPEVRTVVLSKSADDEDVFDAIRAGAAGYVLKDSDIGDLPARLAGVLAGESMVAPVLVTRLLEEFRAPTRRRLNRGSPAAGRLTTREWDVMELLAEGLSTTEVAGRLHLTPTTVRRHVSSVVRKLRVPDRRAALAALANAAGA